jgi:hypothetical protein
MRKTMVAVATACSLCGFAAAKAEAGVPQGGLLRDNSPALAQMATPGAAIGGGSLGGATGAPIGGATTIGTAPNSAAMSSPSPSATGAPVTSGAINQANGGQQALPSSALPGTTETVPPTTSSIAPPQTTSDIAPPQTTSSIAPPQTTSDIAPPQTTSDIAPPPNPSSIAPLPSQSLAPQGPTQSGLFTNVPLPDANNSSGSFNVATPQQSQPAPSTNGGSNFNVPGWDHP